MIGHAREHMGDANVRDEPDHRLRHGEHVVLPPRGAFQTRVIPTPPPITMPLIFSGTVGLGEAPRTRQLSAYSSANALLAAAMSARASLDHLAHVRACRERTLGLSDRIDDGIEEFCGSRANDHNPSEKVSHALIVSAH